MSLEQEHCIMVRTRRALFLSMAGLYGKALYPEALSSAGLCAGKNFGHVLSTFRFLILYRRSI